MRPSLSLSVIGTRLRKASTTRDSKAGYTIGVFLVGKRKELGEFRPPCNGGIGGRDERCCSKTLRMEFVAADIDMERSWIVRSLQGPAILGIVLDESDDRRAEVTEELSRDGDCSEVPECR